MTKKSITIGIVIAIVIVISIIAVELGMNKEETPPQSNLPTNSLPPVLPSGKVIKLNLTESVSMSAH